MDAYGPEAGPEGAGAGKREKKWPDRKGREMTEGKISGREGREKASDQKGREIDGRENKRPGRPREGVGPEGAGDDGRENVRPGRPREGGGPEGCVIWTEKGNRRIGDGWQTALCLQQF